MATYTLSSRVFLNKQTKCYENVIVIDRMPEGVLASVVRRVSFPAVSTFQSNSYGTCCTGLDSCAYAIAAAPVLSRCGEYGTPGCGNSMGLLNVTNISLLFSFLSQNGYVVDTKLTNMMNKSDVSNTSGLRTIAYITSMV